ncbi:MAG: hypothetical protein ACTSR8_05915 [Promethearchaeota archaeon]
MESSKTKIEKSSRRKPKSTLFFEVSDPHFKKIFFILKEILTKEQIRQGKIKGEYLTNIQCLRLILEKLYEQYKFETHLTIEKLKELAKKNLRARIELDLI